MPDIESFMYVYIYIYSYIWSHMCIQSLGCIQLFATPWTIACQAPLSMRFFQARILEWVACPLPEIGNSSFNQSLNIWDHQNDCFLISYWLNGGRESYHKVKNIFTHI